MALFLLYSYRGVAPFSEPELRSLIDYIVGLGNVKSYWNVHSYGQVGSLF